MSPDVARSLEPGDARAARDFVEQRLAGTPYVGRMLELLDEALSGHADTQALIGGAPFPKGLILFGPVAGASDSWHIRMLVVAPGWDRDAGRPFLDAFIAHVRASGARVVVAELPGDDAIGDALTLLRANGFRQTGRVADYYRDGVSLLFLRREL